ncbi:hypothetical protein, partial [Glycomyces xiaoerkulensis]|uniref:hypothetical protein n=1 Tax=Glycomyces xiaoerkulensis TaxID=2038139 RepID=UPI0012FFF824
MKPLRLARTALAVTAGTLLALGLTAPAAGHHPEGPPQPFFAEHDDTCTFTETKGQLSWAATHPPQPPAVNLRGQAQSANLGDCNYLVPVVPYIELQAYDLDDTADEADWETAATAVDREVVPIPDDNPIDFRAQLTPTAWIGIEPPDIDVVTVRACLTTRVHPPEDQTYDGDCGKPDVHHP